MTEEYVDEIETLARDRAKQLFSAEYVNVQPHSGSQANPAAYSAVINPGDTILGLDLAHGGHNCTHGHRLNFSGKPTRSFPMGTPRRRAHRFDEVCRVRATNISPR